MSHVVLLVHAFCSHDNKVIGEIHVIISLEDHGCVQSCDPPVSSCDPTVTSHDPIVTCDPVVTSCDNNDVNTVKPSVPQSKYSSLHTTLSCLL